MKRSVQRRGEKKEKRGREGNIDGETVALFLRRKT